MTPEQKHEKLMEAFIDQTFQDELKKACNEIEDIFGERAKKVERICDRIANVFSVESRVKSPDSFEEKIYRKNYIATWDISEDKNEIQNFIKENLTDVIGVRINCYFKQYEKTLYDSFKAAENELTALGFEMNFDENTVQKNGHTIYKFSGKYNSYHFEVQIKSVIHNVWGETEHKTVYKNLSYDGYIKEKHTITDSLYDILKASENQLYSLFSMEETEDQLIRSLFFCQSKNSIAERCKTKILAYHYENYFRFQSNIAPIKDYVVRNLQGQAYEPQPVEITRKKDDLKSDVLSEFPVFYLECLFHIDNLIHRHESFDTFLSYFLESVITEEETDEFDEEFGENFDDEDEQNDIDLREEQIEKVNVVLGSCRIKK